MIYIVHNIGHYIVHIGRKVVLLLSKKLLTLVDNVLMSNKTKYL